MVLFISLTHKDFGPMARSEFRAQNDKGLFDEAKYGAVVSQVESRASASKAKVADFIIPIMALIAIALFFFPMTTWMLSVGSEEGQFATLGEAIRAIPVGEAFNGTDSSMALMFAAIFANVFAYLYFMLRKLLTIKTAGEALLDGFRAMVPAVMILTLAWSIGVVIKSSPADGGVGLSNYVSDIVVGGNFPMWLMPIIVYIFSCLISFSSGTSWGTMSIMIPIALPVMIKLAQASGLSPSQTLNAAALMVGTVMGGAVFGDHCSPISDTTVLSSTGAAVPHLEHVLTQIPYAVFVAVCVLFGTLAGGLTWNAVVGLLVTLVLFVAGTFMLPKWFGAKKYE